ncbi:MAG TPA: class I SAM-dependent methyltransferase [Cyclobacteriaceae bacterium]|nr:class I SAM-dependent methyltransferase [Cyclobacteriaceae bacterium]
MSINHWSSFWKKPNDAFDDVMRVSTDFFYNQLTRRFPLITGSSILDYGCGPGFLVRNLMKSDVAVTAVDINEHYIKQNKIAFPSIELIEISEDTKVTFKVLSEKFTGRLFDRIILLSIVQYFKSKREVEDVVGFLARYLKPEGQMIVADVLHENTSSARDAIGVFLQCIRRGRIFAFGKFILYLIFSDYRRISKENELLLLSSDFVDQMAGHHSMAVSEAKGMTPHPTRTSYIFTLKGSATPIAHKL